MLHENEALFWKDTGMLRYYFNEKRKSVLGEHLDAEMVQNSPETSFDQTNDCGAENVQAYFVTHTFHFYC